LIVIPKEKIIRVNDSLKKIYPAASVELQFSTGFELLVAVILSAQCTDDRVNAVTASLFKKYKSPEGYLEVPEAELQEDIRPTGFYRNKAKALRACCKQLIEEFKGEIPQQIDEMIKLSGVGRKTAAMVLGNAYGLNQGIAVDTHVVRVVKRLNLSRQTKVEKIESKLMQIVPEGDWTQFSNSMILFGRRICQARKPKCPECPFKDWCPSPDKTV
jgi:endonuclease-3